MSFYSHLPLEEITEAVARNPDEVDLRLAMAEYYVRQENFQDALCHVRMAEDLVDRNPEVQVWKAMCLIYNGEVETGHQLLQRTVRNNPCCDFQMRLVTEIVPLFTGDIGDPMQTNWLTMVDGCGEAEGATEGTGENRKTARDVPPETVQRANSFIECIQQLQTDSECGLQLLVNHVSEYPEDINARLYLAIAYCGLGELAAAAQTYRQVIELDHECATAYFDLAAIVNNTDESISLTQQGLQFCPLAKHARYNLGMFLIQRGDYIAARQELTRIPADSSIYIESLVATGMSYEEENDIPCAIECLEMAVALRPNRADIRGKYGQLLCECGLHDEALAELELAISLNPDQYCVWANKGLVHLHADQPELALEALQRSLDLNPESEDAAINLAVLLGDAGSVEEGIEVLTRALDHHPDHPLIYQNLGAFYCNLRRLDQALEFTLKSIELGIDSPAIYWNLANIFCFKNDRTKCLEYLAEAIERDGAFAVQFRMDEDFQKFWNDPEFLELITEFVDDE